VRFAERIIKRFATFAHAISSNNQLKTATQASAVDYRRRSLPATRDGYAPTAILAVRTTIAFQLTLEPSGESVHV
jgi:hypothetical protein